MSQEVSRGPGPAPGSERGRVGRPGPPGRRPSAQQPTVVAVPEEVRRAVLRWSGASGQSWLDGLPTVVARLAHHWQLQLGRPFGGGSNALVLAATRADGASAVLKIPLRDAENRNEAPALRLYAGDGAVLLFEDDPESGALLLERLEPGSPLAEHPDRGAAIGIVCGLARRLWRPPPPGHPFATVHEVSLRWSSQLLAAAQRDDARPWSRLATEAAALADELAHAPGDTVVVNRDVHLGNVLAARREPWLLIDPKPLVGDPTFDAGHLIGDLLRPAATPRAATNLVAHLADQLRLEARRVRDWALVRATVNAVWALEDGEDPAPSLARAAALRDATW